MFEKRKEKEYVFLSLVFWQHISGATIDACEHQLLFLLFSERDDAWAHAFIIPKEGGVDPTAVFPWQ